MCELLLVTADQPFALACLWPTAAALERYGIAGFGWGAAWVSGDGDIGHHISPGPFAEDDERAAIGEARAVSALVHLRRPSRLSTQALPDTQPFVDPGRRFAFAHNGDLEGYGALRPRYVAEGRIRGRADSEVGQRWLEDHWDAIGADPCASLAALHGLLGGQANLMALSTDGAGQVYAGYTDKPVFTFELDGRRAAATAIHSFDRSFFRYVAPEARRRHVLHPGDRADLRRGPQGL
jgi:glutamine phosphoribosylpyrophosphate amidotransferase